MKSIFMFTFIDMFRNFLYLLSFIFFLLVLNSCQSSKASVEPVNASKTSVYDKFIHERKSLVKQDSSHYFSSDIVLSQKENELDRRLKEIQSEQLNTYKNNHFFPPARNFYQSKEHIEQNELFKIIQQMPKGGALHIHTLASPDVDWVIDKAIQTQEMYVFWENDRDGLLKGKFQAFKDGEVSEGYVQAKTLFENSESNRSEMKSLLTFDASIDQDSVDIWYEFENIFNRITNFARYDLIMPQYIVQGLKNLAEDNIQHVELRMPFSNNLYDLDHPAGTMPMENFVAHFDYALTELRKIDPEFSLKVIHANLRFRSEDTIWDDMERTVNYKKQYPDLLAGYDLVAEEDAGNPTLFHAKNFIRMDSLGKSENASLPLFLHDGESNWVSTENLYDAILLGTKRIGHGFNLFRFPSLINRVLKDDICLEINPLSNQILGYVRDLRLHPASTYLRRGVNCTISSDDPMIFNYKGLSYDYWNVFMAWELDLAAMKKLSMNGILYSALDPTEKEKALKIWNERWDLFIDNTLKNVTE